MAQQNSQLIVGKKESVVDEMLLLSPHQIPLLSLVGFGEPVYNTRHEWVEDEMFAYETKLVSDAAEDATGLEVVDGSIFRPRHVIQVDDEYMLVTGVNGNTVNVTRGYLGSTATAHTANAVVEVLYNESEEGAEAREARVKQRKLVENYTQIFDETIEISGSAMEVAQYGIDDEYERQRLHKQSELALQLEKALIAGPGVNNGMKRYMRGIRNFIVSNIEDASGQGVSVNMLNDALQKIYAAGGFKTVSNHVIMTPAAQKRAIASIGEQLVRHGVNDRVEGRVVDTFISDFGEFPIILNDNLKSSEIMIVDLNRISVRPLGSRSFTHEYLGKQGDFIKGQIIGEYVLQFEQEKAHAKLVNLK
jgi:Family of unknown function (DUF5309)